MTARALAIAVLYIALLSRYSAAQVPSLSEALQEYQWRQQLIDRQRDDDARRWSEYQQEWRDLARDNDAWQSQRQDLRHRGY